MPALRINVGLVVKPEMRGSRADSSIDGSDAPSAKILMRVKLGLSVGLSGIVLLEIRAFESRKSSRR